MRRVLTLIAAGLLLASSGVAAIQSQLLVSTDWLARNMGRHDLTIIEIGDRPTFEKGHIPHARFVASNDIVVDRAGIPNELPDVAALERTFAAAGVSDQDRIVIYAHDIIYAARAFFTLDYLGCGDRISILDGGFAKWTAEKRLVAAGAETPGQAAFVAHPKPEVVAEIAQVRSAAAALIDARSSEQYEGTESGAGIKRPGHIPGAINIPWDFNLTADTLQVFRDTETLQYLYHGCGVALRGSVIVYCRSGMQASVTYFVLRYLGTDVQLYDGSYAEWSNVTPTAKSALGN
jgi:thiosulfate/3-mercaptopyruvate sulfurtransferase